MGKQKEGAAVRLTATLAACAWGLAAGQAWGINCDNAKSAVEKRICANPRLVRQDELLNAQYRMALGRGDRPQQIRKSQVKWLKEVRAY